MADDNETLRNRKEIERSLDEDYARKVQLAAQDHGEHAIEKLNELMQGGNEDEGKVPHAVQRAAANDILKHALPEQDAKALARALTGGGGITVNIIEFAPRKEVSADVDEANQRRDDRIAEAEDAELG